MITTVLPVQFGQAARIQFDLMRRLGRVWGIVIATAAAMLVLEAVSAKLLAAGEPPPGMASLRLTMAALLALAWGAALWRGEGPANRQYFLSQPVDVSAHELSRIAAGAGWFAIALAAGVIVSLVGSLFSKDPDVFAGGVWPWIAAFTGPMIVYLLVASIATLTDRVAEVLIFGYLSIVLLIAAGSALGAAQRVATFIEQAITGHYGIRAAISPPYPGHPIATVGRWLTSMAIWYLITGLAITGALVWRRRHTSAR